MTNDRQEYAGDPTRSLIPVFGLGSIVCSLISGIIMAAYVPQAAPMGWPTGFIIASVILLGVTVVSLLRRPNFVWKRFFTVARWVILMTLVISAMLAYVFIFDGTRGSSLLIMVLMLAITAIDVPILWGFSVARHERIQNK